MKDEEIIIDESELDDLLNEAKGESTDTVVETEKETELELEPENQEDEGIELEVEEPLTLEELNQEEADQKHLREMDMECEDKFPSGTGSGARSIPDNELSMYPTEPVQPITQQTGLVAPVCSVQESVRIFKEFEQAKKEILTSKDIIWFGDDGRPCEEGRGSPHIKRPGWRKLARFFGLSWDIINVSHAIPMQNGGYMYRTKVKIWHPAGASVVAEGIATSKDPFFTKGGRKDANEEDVIMKSETVAINRGIDDILGGGEVSAEELE